MFEPHRFTQPRDLRPLPRLGRARRARRSSDFRSVAGSVRRVLERGGSILVLATPLALLAPHASAQQTKRLSGPLRSVALDVQTGAIRRGPVVDDKGSFPFNTVSVFDNVTFGGFVSVDTGPGAPAYGPCEWFVAVPNFGAGPPDRTGGESQFVTALRFIYCSGALDVLSGGPGGSAIVTFREGYTRGTAANAAGPTGTEVARFSITGLPANTGAGGYYTRTPCYYVTVATPTTVLHDGPMGYSWEFADLGNDGIYAATFPWLSCIQSCTGPGPSRQGGLVSQMDQYCPAGSPIRSSFTFATSGQPGYYIASISMEILEAQRIDSVSALYNGTGVNTAALGALGVGPILGQPWGLDADCTGADPSKSAVFVLGFFNPPPTPTPFGERLVNMSPGYYVSFVAPHGGGHAQVGPMNLPLDLTFYNASWVAQALCGDSPEGYLTKGLAQTVGSH